MSDIVYDKGQPSNLKELEKRVLETAETINIHKRDMIKKLYSAVQKSLPFLIILGKWLIIQINGILFDVYCYL